MVDAKGDRPLFVYVAAAAVLALVVGVVVARGMGGPPAAEVATVSPVAPVVEEVVAPEPISEADLLASLESTEAGALAVVPRAEWFVADYFTADGAGDRQGGLEEALGWAPPALAESPTTYVEWARAWDSIDQGDGLFRVSVAYRAISSEDGAFVRDPVRGVAVSVQLGADGGTRVVDLPSPVPIPSGPEPTIPAETGPVPDDIAAMARDLARSWSGDVTVVGGVELTGSWRVLLVVGIESGHWPLVVSVEK